MLEKLMYVVLGLILFALFIQPNLKEERKLPTEAKRSITVDRIDITNTKGEVIMSMSSETNPIMEIRSTKGKVITLPMDKLAERLQSFSEQ
jgi:hypothetical protein